MLKIEIGAKNIADSLSQHSLETPDKLALTYLNLDASIKEDLTFFELQQRALKGASYLRSECVDSASIVVALPPSPDFMASLFGCFYAGKVAVPFYPPDLNNLEESAEKIIKVAHSAKAKYVICPAESFSAMKKICNGNLVPLTPSFLLKGDIHQAATPERNPLALLLYTSGSTGTPKGVMISHKSLVEELANFQKHCACHAQEVICTWLPNTHVAGLYLRFLGIFLGARNILFSPAQFLQCPELWLKSVSLYKASISAAPNFAYDLCAKSLSDASVRSLDLSSWRMAISGGEQIRPETVEAFEQRFRHHGFKQEAFTPYYGLTETLCASIAKEPKKPAIKAFSRSQLQKGIVGGVKNEEDKSVYVSNGKGWNTTTIRIVDPETKMLCPSDRVGEIWVQSSGNTQGYWQLESLSREVCQAYIQDTQEGPFFRTGDLGFLKDGELYVTSRLKELIIINGKNYYPEDIEKNILQGFSHKGVSACAAFSVNRLEGEELIIVIETTQKASLPEKMDLVSKIKGSVAQRHGINVKDAVIVESLSIPRTATRKIQRSVCAHHYLEGRWQPELSSQTASNTLSFHKVHAQELDLSQRIPYVENFLIARFSEILSLPSDHIQKDQPIRGLSVNSIAIVKLISELREKCSPFISYSTFFDGSSIAQLAKEISQYLDAGEKGFEIPAFKLDYEKDLELLDVYLPRSLPEKSTELSSVLLTGGTGFLGSYLLRDLLEMVPDKVYCLVRAKTELEALTRLKKNMEKGPGWKPFYIDKIKPVLGDFSQTQFGLSDSVFSDLSECVDAIYHNGAAVNFVAPYESLKNANVLSLYEVFKLATLTKLKPVHFVSTIAVYLSPDRYQSLPIKEHSLLPNPNRIFGGYAQSKWVAETLCARAFEKGLPIHIYRPGIISGDSRSGYVNLDDFLCRFIKGCLQMGFFPDIDIEIDMSPVDYVSRAIVALSQQETDKVMPRYHLINAQPTTLKKWMLWLQNNGFSVKGIPLRDWISYVKDKITEDNDLYPVLPFIVDLAPNSTMTLLDIFKDKPLGLDTTCSRQALSGKAIDFPMINDNLFRCYVGYFESSGYFSSIVSKKTEASQQSISEKRVHDGR